MLVLSQEVPVERGPLGHQVQDSALPGQSLLPVPFDPVSHTTIGGAQELRSQPIGWVSVCGPASDCTLWRQLKGVCLRKDVALTVFGLKLVSKRNCVLKTRDFGDVLLFSVWLGGYCDVIHVVKLPLCY